MGIRVSLSVHDFALPAPRQGSLQAGSGDARAAAVGIEIHRRVQSRRARCEPGYQSEVRVSHEFRKGDFIFQVSGRMDGLCAGPPPRIEEIKTAFDAAELAGRLAAGKLAHPYALQLATYGYIHWLQNAQLPGLSFHLVSTRGRGSRDLALRLDLADYEAWLGRRLEELEAEAARALKRADRRRRSARALVFPFDQPRPGQLEIVAAIAEALTRKKPLLLQAPTGLGKTVAALYPVLQEALGRGQRVVYATPKNSQHAVAEEALELLRAGGAKIKSVTITAKSKLCFLDVPFCDAGFCEFARGYYDKSARHGAREALARKRKLSGKALRELGRRWQLCPYELQFEAAAEADVVVCDYNYVFAPRSALARIEAMSLRQQGRPALLIDEAHNLPARAMEYYSPALSVAALEELRPPLQSLPAGFRTEAGLLLDRAIGCLLACKPPDLPEAARSARIEPALEPFCELETDLQAFLDRYLASDAEFLPRDPALRLVFDWSQFLEALELARDPARGEFFVTFQKRPGPALAVTCCDASLMLRPCFEGYDQVVAFSATLKPFDYYARLSGLDPAQVATAEFRSPFPPTNRKLLIIPQISTKYSRREASAPRIAEAVARISALRPGNYFAFFPSFEFLDKVAAVFAPPPGFALVRQQRRMRALDIELVLEGLKRAAQPTIVFAVQGGVFSEGVDYPGEALVGAFIVGPPLPLFDLEREEMRRYYEKNYGSGFDFAYTFPAMAKAVQAAGRVIRSETDRGLIVLLDSRFLEPAYARSMPADWFAQSPAELVSTAILKDVAGFWAAAPAA
jgi:DNA excision repair protein ERCC-2